MAKYKKLFIEIIILLILLAVLSGYLYLTNVFVIKQFNKLQKDILFEFNDLTGFNLSYSSISPNIISSIKMKNVKIYKDKNLYLQLGDVIVDYSIFNFLRNKNNLFSLIKRITLSDLTFFSEKDKLQDSIKNILDRFKSEKKSGSSNKDILTKIKDIEIKILRSKIEISDKKSRYIALIKNINFFFKNRINIDATINFMVNNENITMANFLIRINEALSSLQDNPKSFFYIDFIKNEINGINIKKQRFSFESEKDNFFLKRLKDNLKFDIIVSKENDNIFAEIKSDISYNDIKNFIDIKSNNIPKYLYVDSNLSYNMMEKKVNGNIYLNSLLNSFSFLKNPELVVNMIIRNNILKVNDISIYTDNRENFISLDPNSKINLDMSSIKTSIKIKDLEVLKSKINTEINIIKEKNSLTVGWDYFLINGEEIGGVTEFVIKDYDKYLNIETTKKFNGYSLNGMLIKKDDSYRMILNNNFDNFLLNKIVNSFNILKIKESMFLNGSFTIDYFNGNLFLPESNFVINDSLNKILSFTLSFNNNNLFLKNITHYKYNINSNAFISFSSLPYYSNIIIKKDNLDFNINLYIFKNRLAFDINKDFSGYLNYNNKIIYLKANDFSLPFKNNDIKISFDTSFNLNDLTLQDSSFTINKINIFNNRKSDGNLSFNLSISNNKILLNNFLYKDGENNIEGKVEQNILLKNNSIKIIGNGLLKDNKKAESYSISYDLDNNNITGRLYLTHIELNKFLKGEGFLDLRIGLNGKIDNPDIEVNGILSEGKIGKNNVKADFNIKKVDTKISFNRIAVDFGKNSLYINDSYLKLDKIDNEMFLNGTFYLNGLGKIFKSDFNINGNFGFIDRKINSVNFDISLNNMTLGILEDNAPVKIEKYNDVKFNLNFEDNIWSLKNYGNKFLYASHNIKNKDILIRLYNNNEAFFDLGLNIDKKLDGNVKFIKFPVNLVQKVLIPYVDINKGELTGNVSISGTLSNPDLNGKLNLYYGGVILRKYMIEPIENITAVLFIEKNKIFVNNVNGMVQKSMVHGFGEIIFNGFKFERYSFKLDSEKVPAVVKEGPIDGKGVGYLEEFIIQSDSYSFDFIGKILLEKGEITIANMLGGSKNREPKTYPINVILDIKAGKNVKVDYPIINGTIKEGDILKFKYIGSEPNIYLGGIVNLKKGEINYFNRNFQIESASFQFFENEYKINPLVNIKSFFRTKDSKGESMKVYLSVNDRLSSFKTELSSIPYKSEEELNALLGITFVTNKDEFTSNKSTQDQYIDTIVNTTNYFGNTFLFSPFETTIRRITGLDTFSLHTSLFGNIIRSSDYWLDLLNDTSLTFGKYLSNEIYLGSTMTFKKKSQNEEIFLPVMNENYGLNFQFMLQFELPYMSFGYTFVPNDWKNFLNADHRLSFEANFRF
ncbi:MAG TPA: hypothetical protein PLE45_01495 [Spirochaetota bacterium]|nr:hypothetical protein [Spirochaetota bacterium]HOL56636.1 hypothetical protein [Spirochaetota bacterium]HPP03726.1 hypothetical protein [Spirochaetota bacterium]